MKMARLSFCLVVGIMTAAPYVIVQKDISKISYSLVLFATGTLVCEKLTRRMP